jgi:hypothetical protein
MLSACYSATQARRVAAGDPRGAHSSTIEQPAAVNAVRSVVLRGISYRVAQGDTKDMEVARDVERRARCAWLV